MDNYRYVFKCGKRLRTGYTTGSCAAAASKAAVQMLYSGEALDKIEIDTPKGWRLKLDVVTTFMDSNVVSCYVVKDAGDDPDITDGIEVHAKAVRISEKDIFIKAGKGIGTVTGQGLSVEAGKPAINPTPMKMIIKEVKEVLPADKGVEVELSIPTGEEIAKRTYNPKLGIIGGISILGTSGIVEPMSEDAIKDTIALELSVCKGSGRDYAILVPGNYGEDFCRKRLNLSDKNIVKVSNYIGFALEKCAELGFKKTILAGHIGKLIKVAGGIFYTHSRISDTRMEILTAYLGIMGCDTKLLCKVMDCRTTEEAISIIDEAGYSEVYDQIAHRCQIRCEDYVYNSMEAGIFVFSMKTLLSKSPKADKILEEIANE